MAFLKAQIPAVSLLTTLSGAGTSMTVTPYPVDLDGNKITMAALQSNPQVTADAKVAGYEEIIGFTGIIDNGNNTATLTGLTRDLASSNLATPGTGKQHGAGCLIIFSINPQDIARIAALENDQTFSGINTFSQSPVVPAPTTNLQAATKKYVDDIVSTGTPDASTVTKGKVLMSVSPVSAGSPIAVGDNDTRVPTSGQAAALAGTNGTPNGTTNKYVTATDTTLTGAEQTSNKDTTTTLGTSDTKYPSQKAVKTYVDNQTPSLVNASELLNTYETLELPILNNNTTIFYGWLASSVTNASQGFSANSAFLISTGSGFALSTLLPGSGAQQNYRYDEGKIIRIKARLKFNTGSSIRGFGLAITTANIYTAQTDTTNGEIRFVLNNTTLYAQNANGTATSTNITGSLTLSNWNTYEIVFTPGVSALFYVNGTLVATQTTNLPTTGTPSIVYGDNGGDSIVTSAPVVSIQN